MRRPSEIVLVSLLLLGCGQGSSNSAHDASPDNQLNVNLPDLPPGCPPTAGNENGIGTPCTANTNQCGGSLTCSCDNRFGYSMPQGLPCFCTNLTFGGASQLSPCGSNAAPCTYDIPVNGTNIPISACFPSVCLANDQCPSITQ